MNKININLLLTLFIISISCNFYFGQLTQDTADISKILHITMIVFLKN